MLRYVSILLLLISTTALGEDYKVVPLTETLRDRYQLDPWYEQVVDTGGFPVAGSNRCSPYALKETAYLIDQVLGKRDDIRKALVKNGVRMAVMASSEFTTDVPEHKTLEPAIFWNKRARGLGATRERPAVSCAEENLLGIEGDPYRGENICIHEFAHALHEMGLNSIDQSFQTKLEDCYRQALEEGLWKETYAATNPSEYWAEAVQSWFHCNRTNVREHNHVNSREELRKYDPRIASLLESVFEGNGWVYIPTLERIDKDHLKDYDPKTAPHFEWPAGLVEWNKKHAPKGLLPDNWRELVPKDE